MAKKRNVKVVKRTQIDGNIFFVIQVQTGYFKKWVDAWDVTGNDLKAQYMHTSLPSAIDACRYFDGREDEDEDVWNN